MNEIANKSLLAGYRFMPEMNLGQPGFTYSAYALKKNKCKKLKKQDIQEMFIKTNQIKLAFSMT